MLPERESTGYHVVLRHSSHKLGKVLLLRNNCFGNYMHFCGYKFYKPIVFGTEPGVLCFPYASICVRFIFIGPYEKHLNRSPFSIPFLSHRNVMKRFIWCPRYLPISFLHNLLGRMCQSPVISFLQTHTHTHTPWIMLNSCDPFTLLKQWELTGLLHP